MSNSKQDKQKLTAELAAVVAPHLGAAEATAPPKAVQKTLRQLARHLDKAQAKKHTAEAAPSGKAARKALAGELTTALHVHLGLPEDTDLSKPVAKQVKRLSAQVIKHLRKQAKQAAKAARKATKQAEAAAAAAKTKPAKPKRLTAASARRAAPKRVAAEATAAV